MAKIKKEEIKETKPAEKPVDKVTKPAEKPTETKVKAKDEPTDSYILCGKSTEGDAVGYHDSEVDGYGEAVGVTIQGNNLIQLRGMHDTVRLHVKSDVDLGEELIVTIAGEDAVFTLDTVNGYYEAHDAAVAALFEDGIKLTVDSDNKDAGDDEKLTRECKGFFADYPIEAFSQNENYCDDYLKSKGLFTEPEEG